MAHLHRYKVLGDSVFGLKHVHAVMRCVGVVDKNLCGAALTKVLEYGELEKTGVKRIEYFYVEKAEAQPQWVSA